MSRPIILPKVIHYADQLKSNPTISTPIPHFPSTPRWSPRPLTMPIVPTTAPPRYTMSRIDIPTHRSYSHLLVVMALFVLLLSFAFGIGVVMTISMTDFDSVESWQSTLIMSSMLLYGFSNGFSLVAILWWVRPNLYINYQVVHIAIMALSTMATTGSLYSMKNDIPAETYNALFLAGSHQLSTLTIYCVWHLVTRIQLNQEARQAREAPTSKIVRFAQTMV